MRTGHSIGRPVPTTTNTGKILAHLRMSKSQLCRETGIHDRTMTEILAGRKPLTLEQRTKIAAALEVSPKLL